MSASVAAVSAIVVAYVLTHPTSVANRALRCHLRQQRLLAWLLGKLHSGVYYFRLLAFSRHTSQDRPVKGVEELARFQFYRNGVDVGTITRIHGVLDAISELTTTSVQPSQSFDHLKAVVGSNSFHDLGFQTESPANDFRGAGQFGLQLFEFVCGQPDESARIIRESGSAASAQRTTDMLPWYPVALVSIRLSMKFSEILNQETMLVLRILQLSENYQKDWLEMVKHIHFRMLCYFHDRWLESRESGKIRHYFDTETVLKEFEEEMPLLILQYK